MIAVGIVVALIVGLLGQWPVAPVVGWAAACLVFVTWAWIRVAPMDARRTSDHASREDPSKTTSSTLLLLASVASLAALVFVLAQAQSSSALPKVALAVVGVASLVLSWGLVHTLYTLRYAILYYADSSKPIDFQQKDDPRYLDFAYLAFTIGMTFQVSDTNLQSSVIRVTALRHALVSYLFGAVILAGAVNIVAGLGSG
jgi:uncharacterized membrane protein